jgi:BirA family transcriptional regulator, biotin operon repressor / biotin---[acetyl-CoA-carboxylase] ligase
VRDDQTSSGDNNTALEESSTERAFRERGETRALRQALKEIGIDAPVHYDEITNSTNSSALRLAELGYPEWTIAAAGHQTAGRGRLGRTWVSIPGQSLLFSMVLRPDLEAEGAVLVTLLAGAAMARACHSVADADVRCKWPNDLVLPEGKVGGILTEAKVHDRRIEHLVVGAGINLGAPPSDVENAAAVRAQATPLLVAFLRRFREIYPPIGPAFGPATLRAYTPLCATLGRQVQARTMDGRIVDGMAVDIDRGGNLVVRTEEGMHTVGFGEIEHLD